MKIMNWLQKFETKLVSVLNKKNKMKKIFTLIMLCASIVTFGQSIEKKWNFSSITTVDGSPVISINESDVLSLTKGNFNYSLIAKDSLKAEGNYIHQNNLLIFNHKEPKDTVRYYNVVELTDDALTLSEKNVLYKFKDSNTTPVVSKVKEIVEVVAETSNQIIPSQGFSMQSLGRGVLGMIVLLIVAFLFSANRRGIELEDSRVRFSFSIDNCNWSFKNTFCTKSI